MKQTIGACLLLLLVLHAAGFDAQVNGDWPSVGHDPAGQRFSPLTQITPALQRAWTFDAGSTNLQVTPLVIGGRMYLTADEFQMTRRDWAALAVFAGSAAVTAWMGP